MKDMINMGDFPASELEAAGVISNVQYSESVISITDYDETCTKDVLIPGKIEDKTVVSIENSAFSNNQLTSVTIPNSVTTIESYAFDMSSSSNPNLTSIINTTERSFNLGSIITGRSETSSITGTYNWVNVT